MIYLLSSDRPVWNLRKSNVTCGPFRGLKGAPVNGYPFGGRGRPCQKAHWVRNWQESLCIWCIWGGLLKGIGGGGLCCHCYCHYWCRDTPSESHGHTASCHRVAKSWLRCSAPFNNVTPGVVGCPDMRVISAQAAKLNSTPPGLGGVGGVAGLCLKRGGGGLCRQFWTVHIAGRADGESGWGAVVKVVGAGVGV